MLKPLQVTRLYAALLLSLVLAACGTDQDHMSNAAAPAGMRLIFPDEFNDEVVNTSK